MNEADIEITTTIEGTERLLSDGKKVRLDAVYDPFDDWTVYYVVVYVDEDEVVSKVKIYECLDENKFALKSQVVPYTKVLSIYDSLTK